MTAIRIALAALLATLAVTGPASAGMVTTCFNRADCQDRQVLEHVKLKGTIAEFLDPADTGIGKSISFILFQEVLSAISDQAGTGVIIATPPEGERVVDLLEADYHRAAEALAEFQDASLALWGAVVPDGPERRILVETYLTRLPRADDNPAELALYSGFGGFTGVRAGIVRNRFNFAAVSLDFDRLVRRPVITRTTVSLRTEPAARAEANARVPAGTVLQIRDMRDNWLWVEGESARGWMQLTDRLPIRLPPRTVEARLRNVNLRSGPGKDFGIEDTRSLRGSFRVLDERYREGHGTWYRIDLDGRPLWIAAFLVRPRWSLPAVHFMAGLYRFQVGRYRDAIREFRQFASFPGVTLNNVNLAAAYQFAGISTANQTTGLLQARDLEDFDRAVAQTPFDPTAYNLRAVARIAVPDMAGGAATDLETSFRLDPGHDPTTQLIGTLAAGLREQASFEMDQQEDVVRMLKRGTRDATALPALTPMLEETVRADDKRSFLNRMEPLLEKSRIYEGQ